jgi:hypothetical protein
VIVCKLDLQLPMESVPITTKVVSSNPTQCEVYTMQRYVIKFGSYLWQGSCFFPGTFDSYNNKTDSPSNKQTKLLYK